MKTIWKFFLDVTDAQVVSVPYGARVLPAVETGGIGRPLQIWAEVDTDLEHEERAFYVVGTGNPFPAAAARYVGTCMQGPLVWHVYEGLTAAERDSAADRGGEA